MRNSKKLNDGCIKIFHFLRLLYEERAYYKDVIEIFKDEIDEKSANSIQVTLNKYINALKVFGIRIEKVKNKYKMFNSFYTLQLTLGDLKSISMLISAAKGLPNESLKNTVEEFKRMIELRMNAEDKASLDMLSSSADYKISFYYSDIRQQTEKCEELCRENRLLDLIYRKNNQEVRCTCIAQEVFYDSKNVYLRVHDSVKRQTLEIPINSILNISWRPNIVNNVELNTTVVYKLKDRLAKIYRLKENEHSQGYDADGNLVVVNRNEPFEKLLSRLMKYSTSCELISPKYLREDMLKLITDTISNYDNCL